MCRKRRWHYRNKGAMACMFRKSKGCSAVGGLASNYVLSSAERIRFSQMDVSISIITRRLFLLSSSTVITQVSINV